MRVGTAALALLAVALWLVAGRAVAQPEVRVRTPIPGWVTPIAVAAPLTTSTDRVEMLLVDTQLRVDVDTRPAL